MTNIPRLSLPVLALLAIGLAAPVAAQNGGPPPGNPIEQLASTLNLDSQALMSCVGMPEPGGAPGAPPDGGDTKAPAPPNSGNGPMNGPNGGPPQMDTSALLACAQQQNAAITEADIEQAIPQRPAQ